MSDELFSEVTFASLGLESSLLQGVADAGFERCTLIQAGTLPVALSGKDVAGQAQTGSGKSAAFLLAACQHLLRTEPLPEHTAGNPRAIILAPTRELAVQIHKDGAKLAAHTGLRLGVVFGGTGYDTQREMLRRGLDILIGTPGRLIDYYKQHVFNLDGIQVVVLDEADRMFDLGFIKDIRYVLRRMPAADKRLNMLFSATLSHRVSELAWEHMNSPEVVDASPAGVTVDTVKQRLYHVGSDEKISLLLGLLKRINSKRTILFTNTRRAAETVSAYLKGNGYSAGMLSGEVPQNQRLKLLERFTEGDLPILVATDVAARGLHIPEVSHVINYDLPQDAEDYVHRVGRTARVGADGDAVSFACERYVFSLTEIERYIGQAIPVEQVSADVLCRVRPPVFEARSPRGKHARRGSGATTDVAEVVEEIATADPDDGIEDDSSDVNGNVDPALLPKRKSAHGAAGDKNARRRRRGGPVDGNSAPAGGRSGGPMSDSVGNVAPRTGDEAASGDGGRRRRGGGGGGGGGNSAPTPARSGESAAGAGNNAPKTSEDAGSAGTGRRRRRRRRRTPAAEGTG